MNSQKLLDRIELYDGTIIVGIVDFVNRKHIHLYDFTSSNDPNLVLLAMLWRTEKPEIRFSIYASIYAPDINIPQIKLIHKNNIKSSNRKLVTDELEHIEKNNIKATS